MNDINNATQFDFTYAPGTSMEQIIGFEMAGEIWSSHLQDDVTIRIHVESTSELPDEVIGAALPGKKRKVDYKKLWKQMSRDITSDDDLTAFSNLPSRKDDEFKEFSIIANGLELEKTKEFKLANANAKALDLLNDDHNKLDGYIVVNDLTGDSTVGWDYDALRNSEIQNNNLDFLSVAMHEIGHILGFVSGVDDDGWLKVLTESQEKDKELKDKDFKFASPLDLYRYSNSSETIGQVDLSVGGNPFFSIDGGNSNLGWFANGNYTVVNGDNQFAGDGYQASHWQQNSSQGIMNPILPRGERRDISTLDLTAMDVIGWNINTSTPLDWDNLYSNALANSETAMVGERDKDVEKMIEESRYNGRYNPYSWSGVSSYSFQLGLWQFTTLDTIEIPEEIVVDESGDESETDIDDDAVSLLPSLENDEDEPIEDSEWEWEWESEIDIDDDAVDLFPSSENDEDEPIEDSNTLGAEGAFTEEQDGDSLFSETTSEQDNSSYYQSPLLPDVLIPIEFY